MSHKKRRLIFHLNEHLIKHSYSFPDKCTHTYKRVCACTHTHSQREREREREKERHTHTHTDTHTDTHTHTHTHTHTSVINTETTTHFWLQYRWISNGWVLSFFLEVVKHCDFLRDSGRELQTVGPETENYLFPKVSREKQGTVSREVSRERSVLEG